MPPYYVVIQEGGYPGATVAVVRSSQSGEMLASVRLPQLKPVGTRAISAAADDRTFLITDGNALFMLRLAADGRSVRLTRLALAMTTGVPRDTSRISLPYWRSAVLSPDGRTIALAGQWICQLLRVSEGVGEVGCRDNEIRLVSLVTGASRTWKTGQSWQPGSWISWDGNSHVLFSWAAATRSGPQPSGYRLLDVAASGTDLLAARSLPLPPLPVYSGVSYSQSAFVTPDGGAVIVSTFRSVGPDGQMSESIVELSVRTGALVRVLLDASVGRTDLHVPGGGCSVLALGPGGLHALVECSTLTQAVSGRVDDGRFTPLPGLAGLDPAGSADAAW